MATATCQAAATATCQAAATAATGEPSRCFAPWVDVSAACPPSNPVQQNPPLLQCQKLNQQCSAAAKCCGQLTCRAAQPRICVVRSHSLGAACLRAACLRAACLHVSTCMLYTGLQGIDVLQSEWFNSGQAQAHQPSFLVFLRPCRDDDARFRGRPLHFAPVQPDLTCPFHSLCALLWPCLAHLFISLLSSGSSFSSPLYQPDGVHRSPCCCCSLAPASSAYRACIISGVPELFLSHKFLNS